MRRAWIELPNDRPKRTWKGKKPEPEPPDTYEEELDGEDISTTDVPDFGEPVEERWSEWSDASTE